MRISLFALLVACTGTSSEPTESGMEPSESSDTGTPNGPYVDLIHVADGVLGLMEDGSVTTWSPDASAVTVPGEGHLDLVRAGKGACTLNALGEVGCFGDVPDGAAGPGLFVSFADAWFRAGGGWCALREGGLLTCWGSEDAAIADAPTDVAFQKVVLSDYGGLGLKKDGTLMTWGSDGEVPSTEVFLDVAGVPTSLVGVTSNGDGVVLPSSVYASPPQGSLLGTGTGVDFVTDVPRTGTWTSLHADCAIRDDGVPHCWNLDPTWHDLSWPEAPVQLDL